MDWHTAPDGCTLEEGVRRSTFPLSSRAPTTLHIIAPYPIRDILPVPEYYAGAGKANWESENVTRTCYFHRGCVLLLWSRAFLFAMVFAGFEATAAFQ
ncbi:hypothetical protein BV22DRAFT_935428 [Leucogyrophana mollusca]|uniref:Uncharacterized protein n=1 Tax=Leucogyrophana mollusca TaxID=85980 RepID=A0ACB8AWW9_9AGAM|nr:hypothetical protein BV22DRAFT_935428 [Leucogyrophana mollusca]